jgi:glycerophosphoryl diester phosphodiesterase
VSPDWAVDQGNPATIGWLRALGSTGRHRPLAIAHRGDSFHAPENTLEAGRRGRQAGADAWELDVHLTRDGIPVVVHDASLLRTTDVAERFPGDPRRAGGYMVADFELEEVRTLDAGSWFLDPNGRPRSAADFGTLAGLAESDRATFGSGDIRVPTLAEALLLTQELDWLVNVELKSFPNRNPRLLDAVLDVVATTGTAGRVLISSFEHADVARCVRHERRLKLATGVLAATPLYRPERYVRDEVGAVAYHPSAHVLGASSDVYLRAPSPDKLRVDKLANLKAKDVPVLVYTVNETGPDGLAAHLAAAGVDGIFSDDPSGLVQLFHTFSDPSPSTAPARSALIR